MSTARTQPQGFPGVPPSLNAGDYELRDYGDNRAPPNTIPSYTPYLGLRARLSQVWINRWTILLILIIARLLLAIKDINYDIGRAKEEALQACTSVENVGSAMASMPHYLSAGVNSLAADGVTAAVNALMDMLMLSITGVEEIVLFVINMMTSTYVCLIQLAVSGSLEVALDVVKNVGEFFNSTIGDITGTMTTTLGDFEAGLNSFLDKINIPALLGSSQDPPTINLTSQITSLNNITLDPTKFNENLNKINASIPTFEQVQNFSNNVIRTPFEFVKREINESMVAYKFDKSVFDVPPKQALSFCSENSSINDFFDGLVNAIYAAKKAFIIVLTILAVLVCIPMAYREIWRWRSMQQRSALIQKNAFDPMDVIYIASRPYTSTTGIKLASKFKSMKAQILARWVVAYATSLPALFVLALGLAGLFSCLCEFIILQILKKKVPELADKVGDFAQEVVGALTNASEAWAVSANEVINSTNTQINNDVFGWVGNSTKAVNDTINQFTDEMSKELNATFGGTVLYEPITGVLNCLIGLKIASFQKAVTWVSDNAHVTFPQFQKDMFSLGAAASLTNSTKDDSFLAAPGDVTSDSITNAIFKVVLKLESGIRQEAIISTCVVCLWLLIVLIGVARAVVAITSREKTRAEGGPVGYTGDSRMPRSPDAGDVANFPQFGGPLSAVKQSSDENVAWAAGGLADEKFGAVGRRSVEASVKPGHERSSSYGFLDGKR
jgi:hypothetical protein